MEFKLQLSPRVVVGSRSPRLAPGAQPYRPQQSWQAGAEPGFCCGGPCTPPGLLPQAPARLEAAPRLPAPTADPAAPHGLQTSVPYLSHRRIHAQGRAPGQGGSA